MTRALLKSIITKNKLYSKVWNKKGAFEYDAYKQYRNALNRTIKAAKQTIINSKSYYTRMTQRSFGKLYTAYWKLIPKANIQ